MQGPPESLVHAEGPASWVTSEALQEAGVRWLLGGLPAWLGVGIVSRQILTLWKAPGFIEHPVNWAPLDKPCLPHRHERNLNYY